MNKMGKGLFKPSSIVLILFGVLFTVFVPQLLNGYSFNIVNNALVYLLCVYGASIYAGMSGQMSLAFITFMGFGAYYAANLCTGRLGMSLSPIAVLLTAPIFVGLISFILGLILTRLKNVFFVFGTLGVVQIMYVFFQNNVPVFGGSMGIASIPTLSIGAFKFDSNQKWIYLLIATAVLGYIIVERVRNSKMGRSLASIKDNEIAAYCMGVNVFMTKVYAFTIAGVFCGLAGAMYAMMTGFVSADLFKINNSFLIIIMLMLGGMNHTVGAVIGALVVSILPETFRSLKSFLMLSYGLVIILLMVFMPSGLAGMGVKIIDKIKKTINSIIEKRMINK